MRKLRLNVDHLQVDSFSPVAQGERGRGTVQAHAPATYGCTEGYAGCANPTIGYTCDVQCSETHGGFSCDYSSCVDALCAPTEYEC